VLEHRVLWEALADTVVVVHLMFVLFVIGGGFLVLKVTRLAWLHLPAVAWGAAIEFGGWICPLTPLENWLRARGLGTPYQGGFMEHYLLPLLYPAALTREFQAALGAAVVLLNTFVYWRAFKRCHLLNARRR